MVASRGRTAIAKLAGFLAEYGEQLDYATVFLMVVALIWICLW